MRGQGQVVHPNYCSARAIVVNCTAVQRNYHSAVAYESFAAGDHDNNLWNITLLRRSCRFRTLIRLLEMRLISRRLL